MYYAVGRNKRMLENYIKTVRNADYAYDKGFWDCKGVTILNSDEVSKITQENPVKGFPLVVYQFVYNDKHFHLGSKFFDRPTETILEEMNEVRRKGGDQNNDKRKFMIQYAVMVYTALNENCINPDNSSCVLEITKITDAIYGETIKLKKCQISDAIKQLEGSYLVNIPNQRSYRFHHQTLQESVILTFAQIDDENINQIIPLISWSFFVKIIKSESYKEKEGEVVLRVPTKSYKLLADRLVDIYIAEYWTCWLKTKEFLRNLSNTEIFKKGYCFLLPCLSESLAEEDSKNKLTENMIRCDNLEESSYLVFMKNKEIVLTSILVILAESENQLDTYDFTLKTLNQLINSSNNTFTIDIIKRAIIKSLYRICSSKDVKNVKATFDMVEENKIPVLPDQGLNCWEIKERDSDDLLKYYNVAANGPICVFLTVCILKAFKAFNIPVLEYILKKYNETPFDVNLFLRYTCTWKYFKQQTHKKVKWINERFEDVKLVYIEFFVKEACHYQMLDTVKYLDSSYKINGYFYLKEFIKNRNCSFDNEELFNFLLKKIDITSRDLIPVVASFLDRDGFPQYIVDAFLPVCLNNIELLSLACMNGQFYVVNRIMEDSHIQFVTSNFQSALISACSMNRMSYSEVEKLKIVKYIVDKCGFEQLDLKAASKQACDSSQLSIVRWFVNNIDLTVLDVYTIIKSALKYKISDILDDIKNKIEIASLDKREVLKSVAVHYSVQCSTTILEIVSKIWDETEDKKLLHMEEIVNTAYERRCFELLLLIHKNCHPHICIDGRKVLMLAFKDGRYDVAKRILQVFGHALLDKEKLVLLVLNKTNTFGPRKISLELLKWILNKIEINPLDLKSIVLDLFYKDGFDYERIDDDCCNFLLSIFDKYLDPDEIDVIIHKSLESWQWHRFVPVKWFLENKSSHSFDKQMILNKACHYMEIETIQMLSKYSHSLDINQAVIHSLRNCNLGVACMDRLWGTIDHDSIDIRTIASEVCKGNCNSTWILLNIPLDQITINKVLISSCIDLNFSQVQYIFDSVENDWLDIKEAFFQACRMKPLEENEFEAMPIDVTDIMLADFLFQKLNDKYHPLSKVENYILESKNFCLILYFLQTGYCKNINMKNLLKQACEYGHCKLVQWILANVEHKELDIKSAFVDASKKHLYNLHHEILLNMNLNILICFSLLWHYIQNKNMFDIDAVLQNIPVSTPSNYTSECYDYWRQWLIYIKRTINQERICQNDSVVLKTEGNKYENACQEQKAYDFQRNCEDLKHNDDSSSSEDCPTPMKKVRFEKEYQI